MSINGGLDFDYPTVAVNSAKTTENRCAKGMPTI
jgi:hypothetical protein